MLKVSVLPGAKRELEEAHQWYLERSKKAADEFVGEFRQTALFLSQKPDLFPILDAGIRKASLSSFPYSIYYRFDDEQLYIIRVFHQSRKPFLK